MPLRYIRTKMLVIERPSVLSHSHTTIISFGFDFHYFPILLCCFQTKLIEYGSMKLYYIESSPGFAYTLFATAGLRHLKRFYFHLTLIHH